MRNEVSKGTKIRNRYNQVPHLTQDTNGKVTNSQLDTTNESQEVSPFPAGDHKAHINRCAQMHSKHKTEKNIEDPQASYLSEFQIIFCTMFSSLSKKYSPCYLLLFRRLLITFASSLDPDQGRQNVGPNLDPYHFTL